MYKLLIISTTSNGVGGGSSAHQVIVSFDTSKEADLAVSQINKNKVYVGTKTTVIPLY